MKTGKPTNMKKALVALNIIAIVGFAGGTAYFYFENRDLNKQINLTDVQKRDNLVEEINGVFDLPDEVPEVVVVTDPETFKTEYTTFDNVETGDHLLVFRKARLGVLYRQSEKRVVKTTSVVIPIAIEIVGSQEATDDIESKLAEFGTQIEVTKTIKDGVTQSFVYDVDADQEAEAASVAGQLKLELGSTLPTSITPASQTEIVIIIANPKTQP